MYMYLEKIYIFHIFLQKIEKLFHEFDYNHNGSLDEEELSGLNCQLFFEIPRLGLKDLSKYIILRFPKAIHKLLK